MGIRFNLIVLCLELVRQAFFSLSFAQLRAAERNFRTRLNLVANCAKAKNNQTNLHDFESEESITHNIYD